jgi:hypothetical protein
MSNMLIATGLCTLCSGQMVNRFLRSNRAAVGRWADDSARQMLLVLIGRLSVDPCSFTESRFTNEAKVCMN